MEDVKKLGAEINASIEALKAEVNAKGATWEKAEGMIAAIEAKLALAPEKEYVEKMQEQLDQISGNLKELAQKHDDGVPSIESQLVKHVTSDKFKQLVKGKTLGSGFELDLKTTTVAANVGAGVIQGYREPGVARNPDNPTRFIDLVAVGSLSESNTVEWIERSAITRAAAMRNENAQFPESTAEWVKKSTPVQKITDMMKLTNEMLEDVDYIMSEVMSIIQYGIPNLRDTQIYKGNGEAPQLKGINEYAKAFALPSGFQTIANPNLYDVIAAIALQIELGLSGTDVNAIGFTPSAIIAHPSDLVNLKLTRDDNGNYLIAPFQAQNGMTVHGIRVIGSTRVTAGDFLMGDFNRAKYYTRRGMNIRFWDQNGTDAEYDRITVTASERGALKVTGPDEYAFVKGTFAAVKEAIKTT